MIVEILQDKKSVNGKVGDKITIDPKLGNHLACIGVVRVVSHGGGANEKKSTFKKQPEIERDELDKE